MRTQKILKEEEKKPLKELTVTLECKYDVKSAAHYQMGATAFAGPAPKRDQALKDWQRAANPKEGGGQAISIVVQTGKDPVTKTLKELLEEIGTSSKYGTTLKGNHYTFSHVDGLKQFFKDFLFAKVRDEKEKELLAEQSLFHIHQGGLPSSLNVMILSDLSQTMQTKTLRAPHKWTELYVPNPHGVKITAEHDFYELIDEEILEGRKKPEKDKILMKASCLTMIESPESKEKSAKVSTKILNANIQIFDEQILDYHFQLGFVKDYAEKKPYFEFILDKMNRLHKNKKSNNTRMNILGSVVDNFRHIQLSDEKEVQNFQTFLRGEMKRVESFQTILGEGIAKLSDGIAKMKLFGGSLDAESSKSESYGILQVLDQFLDSKLVELRAKSKTSPPKNDEDDDSIKFIM